MPFDADAYDLKCQQMDDDVLIARRAHYVRQIASNSTGAALHTAAGAATAGLTWLMIPYDAARIHDARRRRRILEKHAADRGLAIETKCGDVLVPMALGVTLGAVAFEGAQMCADLVVGADDGSSTAAESKQVGEVVKSFAHLGLDAGIAAAEHRHGQREKSRERYEARVER